ncbi:MAG: TetR/AcrR family transcriptional regulator [Dysgonamonadaceae bacterium]|jgi:AcrR family transcriptional regulator|nr:TetR/AcrR family transcriptional regulator [Dysgonamonadaceae bacterium]
MSGAVIKTREKLMDVARKLFAENGIEDVTMNDIATASGKGRRTLYTYFKNKNEIYNAVIESELDILYRSLQEVVEKDLPADVKLLEFVKMRLESTKRVVYRNGSLGAEFFKDIWHVETIRRKFDIKEILFLRDILEEGVKGGIFRSLNPKDTAIILHSSFKGLEVPYIRGIIEGFSASGQRRINGIIGLFFYGLKKVGHTESFNY